MIKEQKLYYDPEKTYIENAKDGPFGSLALGEKVVTEGKPQRLFLGHQVYLDLGISAGPLVNGRAIKAALDLGWDIATYKTVRSREHPVNGFPNLLPTELDKTYTPEIAEEGVKVARSFSFPSSPTNSFGVPSVAPDAWVPDATEAVNYAREGQVVVVSFQGAPKGDGDVQAFIKDHRDVARMAKQTGAKVLEVNGSCPNEGSAHLLCLDYKTSGRVAAEIREEIGDNVKLLMKICYFSDQTLLANFIKSVGPHVDGFTAINTMAVRTINPDGTLGFGLGRERAGLSGEHIRPYGLEMTRRLVHLAEDSNLDFAVIGVGGVFNKHHYDSYKNAGAVGVETATGSLANPRIVQEIKKELGIKVNKIVG